MACLGSVFYDPATAATYATSALAAMTAFDTANARITFTAPSNGNVLVRIRAAEKGATATPRILFGVLDGSTVKARSAPHSAIRGGTTNALKLWEAVMLVTGLTPGQSLTWDAAYSVEFAVALTTLGAGGPNNTTANDAYGGLSFEIWETANLLAGVQYDPSTAAAKSLATASVMAAVDTTNLRLTPVIPSSGRVTVQVRGGVAVGSGTVCSVLMGVLESSTVRMRAATGGDFADGGTVGALSWAPVEATATLSGLTPGSATWDLAWGVEGIAASTNWTYGGPNNATAEDAFGGVMFAVWKS
jgi:hypothetical protein